LMITESGLLKIMDFGIARVRGSQRLTRDGSMVGTLAYMAPEQLRGDSGDERSDLYSLAIVLYEMLSGSTPFEAESDYDLMQAHIHAKPQRQVARVPGLDPRIDAALLRALAKTPAQRFASVREFCDALGATALRVDASKIVYEGTRVLARPTDLAGASGSSGSFTRVIGGRGPILPRLAAETNSGADRGGRFDPCRRRRDRDGRVGAHAVSGSRSPNAIDADSRGTIQRSGAGPSPCGRTAARIDRCDGAARLRRVQADWRSFASARRRGRATGAGARRRDRRPSGRAPARSFHGRSGTDSQTRFQRRARSQGF
jgi:serine/threonine protein kinase